MAPGAKYDSASARVSRLCPVAWCTVLLEVTDVLNANKIWQFLFQYIQVNLSINCCAFGIIHSPARPTPDTAPHTMNFGACLTVGIKYFGLYLCLAGLLTCRHKL